ncbi:hypothetical protein [Bacillus sp. KH172YL63]|uniref:hypothetical protein n=1 Tax=Bacillus sp. KH172YL63 TaxID=2709784 RepID=UPI0013E44414|nr:hypothetical protein [Bacillus sp. KH172YL63]BCB03580.1 hypothetical protein KH172YL63_17130 [Bacillus sp. KH172YL63]
MSFKWTFLFLFATGFMLAAVTILNKPTQDEYAEWLRKEYSLSCNEDCSILTGESSDGTSLPYILVATEPLAFSEGIFTVEVNGRYESIKESGDIHHIQAVGFNGRFYPTHLNE